MIAARVSLQALSTYMGHSTINRPAAVGELTACEYLATGTSQRARALEQRFPVETAIA